MNFFTKTKTTSTELVMKEVEAVLKQGRINPDVMHTLIKFIKDDLSTASAIILIWEKPGVKKETFWDCGGLEPAQAILSLDQLHHRVQHEGLPGYD